ncbi:hypothetical protein YP76_18550 [Sphingobium chungbukense]|uniref:Uncharacterized protein n=1 Tax=Sphingobium chungbukense TaxID=56193 RepID=A0A0M3ANT1_9SPHN|nr:hypothetical protein YP76_18550 [Sphingobium chungbukense]
MPKAFSNRIAISADRFALLFSKVLNACLDTPKCSAKAVTLTCAGSTISDFNQSPTWTASEECILSAMIVLQIHID